MKWDFEFVHSKLDRYLFVSTSSPFTDTHIHVHTAVSTAFVAAIISRQLLEASGSEVQSGS